jgi:hypothetical protein
LPTTIDAFLARATIRHLRRVAAAEGTADLWLRHGFGGQGDLSAMTMTIKQNTMIWPSVNFIFIYLFL